MSERCRKRVGLRVLSVDDDASSGWIQCLLESVPLQRPNDLDTGQCFKKSNMGRAESFENRQRSCAWVYAITFRGYRTTSTEDCVLKHWYLLLMLPCVKRDKTEAHPMQVHTFWNNSTPQLMLKIRVAESLSISPDLLIWYALIDFPTRSLQRRYDSWAYFVCDIMVVFHGASFGVQLVSKA